MDQITYMPKMLRSMAEIRREFGVGDKVIKGWVDAGAPIVVEGTGYKTRYSAEVLRLQLWRERRREMLTASTGLPEPSQALSQ